MTIPSHHRRAGSALLSSLIVLAVVLVAVGAALSEASHRFRTSHQSSRWAQAGQTAEAGVEIAMLAAQNDSWVADGFSASPGAPGAAAVIRTVSLSNGLPSAARIAVDTINMGGLDWLRIRSTGTADMAGGALSGLDPRDILLRKFNLRTDRSTGAALTTPQATRTVEILAEPMGVSRFRRALLLDKKIDMSGGGWVDSFDSSDPTRSTNSLYDVTKRQFEGDIGINDTEGASDLRDTFVYGDLDYSGSAVLNTVNVQGTITTPFSDPVQTVPAPSWTTFNPTPTAITSSATLTGGTKSSPARYKVSEITVGGGKVLDLAPHAAGQESYVEIWVTGKMTVSGSGYVLLQPGVHATYYVEDDITVSGSAFNNQSNVAAYNHIAAITPTDGSSRKVTVSGSGSFIGMIEAPSSDFTISGDADFSGALIGKTITISGGASVHYDKALSRYYLPGDFRGYRVASWLEGVR